LALELTRQVRAEAPETKLIILSHGHLQEQLIECMAAGAHGCLLEEASLKDVAAAVERVLAGETFCSPEIVQPIFHRLAETAQQAEWHQRSQAAELTPRELEILQLIAGRLSNKQIARRLSLSLYTIKNHIHNLLEKLRVEDRHEAVDYARHQQWIK
jgi:DNA-binding NarL/FixJ family response regulator